MLIIDADDSWTYQAGGVAASKEDFAISITDGDGDIASASLTLTVKASDADPTSATDDQGGPIGALANLDAFADDPAADILPESVCDAPAFGDAIADCDLESLTARNQMETVGFKNHASRGKARQGYPQNLGGTAPLRWHPQSLGASPWIQDQNHAIAISHKTRRAPDERIPALYSLLRRAAGAHVPSCRHG